MCSTLRALADCLRTVGVVRVSTSSSVSVRFAGAKIICRFFSHVNLSGSQDAALVFHCDNPNCLLQKFTNRVELRSSSTRSILVWRICSPRSRRLVFGVDLCVFDCLLAASIKVNASIYFYSLSDRMPSLLETVVLPAHSYPCCDILCRSTTTCDARLDCACSTTASLMQSKP